MSSAATHPALLKRFGDAAPDDIAGPNDVLSLLYARRSVRRFTSEPVDDQTITAVIAAAQSAASSSNLQTWSVIELRDPDHKAAASVLAGDQDFIRDAPVFLVFVADWARNRIIAERRGEPSAGIDYLESTLVSFVDAALAAQNAVVAAESLGVGAVFVGAVRNHPEQLADLLALPSGAFAVVGIALGHPDPADIADVKPRLPPSVVRHRETYRMAEGAQIDAYDRTLAAYYASQGQPRGWIPAVLRRVRNAASLNGRDTIRTALERRGLASR